MQIVEAVGLVLIIVLCILCTISDLKYGTIRNKTLAVFLVLALLFDFVYYGYYVNDLLFEFLINLGIVFVVSLILFFTHSFAGGDCKLIIVLSLFYPARFYVIFSGSNVTLFIAIILSIFVGYCYLLANSIWNIITKKVKITTHYIKSSLSSFLKAYLAASIYISLINLFVYIFGLYGLMFNIWITRALCLTLAWFIGRFSVLKRIVPLICASALILVGSILLNIIPFSINPENYILVLILLFCQITIKANIYESIPVSDLKAGMILSTMSTVLMQTSITKGLPKLSTEDLKSRLTDSEINSVKIWAKATNTDTLTIVKKIPFAIFISIGFTSYFVIWRILWA